MEVTKLQEVIDGVPDRWALQYEGTKQQDKLVITKKLNALQRPLKKEDVDRIIGNTTWTQLKCDECEKMVKLVVRLGEEPDYESSTASICLPCLREAVKLARENSTK